jgi:hypothetical protein
VPGLIAFRLRRLLGLEIGLLEDVDEDEGYNVRRGGRLGDWAKIGWMASKRSRRAPAVEFMYVRSFLGIYARSRFGIGME